MRFKDATLAEYRSDQELKRLEEQLSVEAQRLARDLVDELESRGFHTPEDFETRKRLAKAIVDGYHRRLMQRLR